jgi:hypothetical protein
MMSRQNTIFYLKKVVRPFFTQSVRAGLLVRIIVQMKKLGLIWYAQKLPVLPQIKTDLLFSYL